MGNIGLPMGTIMDLALPAMNGTTPASITFDSVAQLLANDDDVKVAGIDGDGVLRGKIMCKDKFLSSLQSGFGMSSAIFGWDMHDVSYATEPSIIKTNQGYGDFIAEIDLASFRRLPFEGDIPFFLLRFRMGSEYVFADGRSMMDLVGRDLEERCGLKALAGVELEFMNFQTPSEDGYGPASDGRNDLASFLKTNPPSAVRPLTGGMFGYSVSRPILNKRYFHDVTKQSRIARCQLEAFHTESGPGVYEAALRVSPAADMADNVAVFKLLTKSVGAEHGITPCFMAKPVAGLPGNSGHVHISLTSLDGSNAFARATADESAAWPDVAYLSDTGRYFLAGLLSALPDIMPMLAPNVNSYKRLVENYWAPVTLSWGLEDRLSSIRLVAPPTCKPSATRFEIRVPGADLHPHYAIVAILRAGLRGIENKMEIPIMPASASKSEVPGVQNSKPALLPNTLEKALQRFEASGSISREILGNDFVDYYAISRHHEIQVWREAVTDWEFMRYVEQV